MTKQQAITDVLEKRMEINNMNSEFEDTMLLKRRQISKLVEEVNAEQEQHNTLKRMKLLVF
jgi:membrane-bound lytic murein transglycosylase MltF